jgi:hypothetical protein
MVTDRTSRLQRRPHVILSALREREAVAMAPKAVAGGKNEDPNHARKMSPNRSVGTL